MGVGVIGGTQQSLLAARLQPPTQNNSVPNGMAFLAAAAVFVVMVVLTNLAQSAFLFVLGLFSAIVSWYWVRSLYLPDAIRVYQTATALWQKQWCCMKCGHVFAWVNAR